MAHRSFEELDVWKRACRLAVELYRLLADCPEPGLKDQMTRAAISVAAQIAEGAERGSQADNVRLLWDAKGSAAELRTHVYIAWRIGVLQPPDAQGLIAELKELSSMLQGLIDTLDAAT